MGNIKIKPKVEVEKEKAIADKKIKQKKRFKNKTFLQLSTPEKWELLEQIAKDFGYIKEENINE